jgi:adenosine deaminase
MNVLIEEKDFYDLTAAYLEKAYSQSVRHVEIFFDPQAHTARGVKFETVINGIDNALLDGENKFGISYKIIMCFLRHLDQNDAFKTLEMAIPFKEKIIGVGLDSSEKGHPPSKFKDVFLKAREEGFVTVAHAGEEGPSEYIREAIDLLDVKRIDHGNAILNDSQLTKYVAEKQIPLTVCPLSNLKLKVVDHIDKHPLPEMLSKGLLVTINSDDPSYFGGYINENYEALQKAFGLGIETLAILAKNSFNSAFINDDIKIKLCSEIDEYIKNVE